VSDDIKKPVGSVPSWSEPGPDGVMVDKIGVRCSNNLREDGHVDCSEVDSWLDIGRVKFEPTPQQKAFRKVAYRLARKGKYFRGEWFRATQDKGYKGLAVSERVWKFWVSGKPHFKEWFFEEFPVPQGVSEDEMKCMDSQFWIGVRDGMQEGEEWAYRQYAKTRFDGKSAKKEAGSLTEMVQMQDYFKGASSSGWKLPSGEA